MTRLADALPEPVKQARKRLGKLRKTRMMVRDVRSRVDNQRKQVETQARQLADQRRRLAAQAREQAQIAKQLKAQTERVAKLVKAVADLQELKARLTPFEKASQLREIEHGRFSFQLGGIEERLGALEQALSDGRLVADDATSAEARSIVDEVRREHEQIRVRMQIVSAYEERLRRVEASVVELYDGDLRHQV